MPCRTNSNSNNSNNQNSYISSNSIDGDNIIETMEFLVDSVKTLMENQTTIIHLLKAVENTQQRTNGN